jgi:phage terminase small subunit
MNERQRRFADYYIETLNATQSAIQAGYSKKTAYSIGEENLRKPEIKTYIADAMAKKESERIASQDEVLKFLTSLMRGEITESIPLGIGPGEQQLVDNEPLAKDRLRAAELLGKRYALFTDKLDVSEKTRVIIVDDIADDDDEDEQG